jgi:DNA-binding protein HU-beta
MKKAELVDEVAKVLNTKKEARLAVDSLLNNISKALESKQDVRLAGFGTFKRVEKKARNGRNPKTGEPIEIKASTKVKFVPGKNVKAVLN